MFPIGPIAFVLGVVGLFLGLIIGIIYRKHIAEAKVGVAEDRAKKIVEDAEKNAELELPEELFSAWGDYLSEICIVLGSEGFTVDVASLEWRPVKISISRDYVGRIVNNIVSNLRKYADRQYPVYMKILYGADTVEIELGNHIRKPNTYVENTGIGVTNIKMMMKQMHGKAIVEMSDSTYVIRLRFPLAT